MIQATPMPPYGAVVASGVPQRPSTCCDINVDPLIGALIMTDTAWEKISAEDHDKIVAAAKAMEKRLQTEVPAQDAKAGRRRCRLAG